MADTDVLGGIATEKITEAFQLAHSIAVENRRPVRLLVDGRSRLGQLTWSIKEADRA